MHGARTDEGLWGGVGVTLLGESCTYQYRPAGSLITGVHFSISCGNIDGLKVALFDEHLAVLS